ncbi:MAG: hypothetical protein K6G83_15745 [Lachnospiraceae bacterium]|nr:hypothetical protein [Lachnospiraceae bacterium]
MKLTGNLKKQVENEGTREGRRNLIEKAGMLLTDEELNMVSGGGIDEVDDNPKHASLDPDPDPGFTELSECIIPNEKSNQYI